jgi:NADH dehydrogenase [ubiquinone] 1 alpha subcomplex assembly factor 3
LNDYSFVDIFADAPRPAISVASITPAAGFTLTDGLIIPSPVIFLNGVVFLWDVAAPNTEDFSWEGWSEAKLKLFEVVTPRPGQSSLLPQTFAKRRGMKTDLIWENGLEILLVGTGKRGLFPPPAFKKYLNGLGIQVDVLDSVSPLFPSQFDIGILTSHLDRFL